MILKLKLEIQQPPSRAVQFYRRPPPLLLVLKYYTFSEPPVIFSELHLRVSKNYYYYYYHYYYCYYYCYYYHRGQPKAGTGYKMQSVPFVFSMSRFQGPAFRCDKIVVIVTLVRCIAGSVGLLFAILRILRKARGNGGYSMFRETYLRATTYE